MLNKDFFHRETNISATVICDSISESGVRITTFEVEAPRIILAEINTHNAISKNCSSTRAITLSKAIEQVETNGFTPLYWGEKKSGMSADKEIEDIDYAKKIWESTKDIVIGQVNLLDDESVHKQISGRLLEPFQMVKQVLTATDLDNFFNLRIHPSAQPEILMLAYKMYKSLRNSNPTHLRNGDWHLPYVEISIDQHDPAETYYYVWDVDDSGTETDGYQYEKRLSLEDAIKISASCCAQVSYRNTDMSLEKADKIFNMLVKADVLHASCFEHLATPIVEVWNKNGDTFDVFINKGASKNVARFIDTWEKGVTHQRKDGVLCSGNLTGWISYRHKLENNTCWKFDFDDRMKLFEQDED